MSRILITRPEHDLPTRYLSRWSTKIIEEAQSKGFEVLDLHREKACQTEFMGRVSKTRPSLVVLNGHGHPDAVTGHNNEVLVATSENPEILGGLLTYAVSCDSAASLGKRVCAADATTFIGYTDKFTFTMQYRKISRPLEDERARPFMEASNHVAVSLLKGHTARQATARAKRLFHQKMMRLLSSTADPDALLDAQTLWWDMQHLVCLGDQEKRAF